jgi:hypothetical protein
MIEPPHITLNGRWDKGGNFHFLLPPIKDVSNERWEYLDLSLIVIFYDSDITHNMSLMSFEYT